jgi:hypothetical protein
MPSSETYKQILWLSAVTSTKRLSDGVVFGVPAPGQAEAPFLANEDYVRYKNDVAGGATVLPPDPLPSRKALYTPVVVEDVRTTTATISTLASWPLAIQTLYTARFTILAIDTVNGDCRVWTAKATAKRVDAGALLVGTPTLETSHADAGAAAWALAADTSGNNFRVRVTGAAGRTVSWSLVGEVLRCRPDGLVD